MVDKTSAQLKLMFKLFLRDIVCLVIKLLYGRELLMRTIFDYLKRWVATSQELAK